MDLTKVGVRWSEYYGLRQTLEYKSESPLIRPMTKLVPVLYYLLALRIQPYSAHHNVFGPLCFTAM